MAVLKCKMCGGDLSIAQDATTAECQYCGCLQTIPRVQDENLQGLYNRANLLRRRSEFDKAEQLYEAGDMQALIRYFRKCRCSRMEELHESQRKVDCLDFLIRQTAKTIQ